MGDRGVNIHRTGETGRRRFPEEDGRKNRRRIRNDIIIDDARAEDLLDAHDVGTIEEALSPTVTQEKKKKSDEELVDNLLVSIFGDEVRKSLETHDFIHPEARPIAKVILALKIKQEREHPEAADQLLQLEIATQKRLKELDQSPDFTKRELFNLLQQYQMDLAAFSTLFSEEVVLEKHNFIHPQSESVSKEIWSLKLRQTKKHPEISDELLRLEQKAQEELKELDAAVNFSNQKLYTFLYKYQDDLDKKLESINNMSPKKETTPPPAERLESTEILPESPAEVAAETLEKIDQEAVIVSTSAPEASLEIQKLATESQGKIKQVAQDSKLEPVDYAENELDKIGKPKSKVEINAESPEAGSKIDKIKSLIKKLNDTFSAAGVEGYAARRKSLQEADDLIGIKQYQDIVLSHSKDKDKELLMNEAIERAVKELEDMLHNEEIRVKNLEKLKEIKPLRDLIKQLEVSFGAPSVDGYDARQKALQAAARILENDSYLVILSHDKDDGMSVNAAIEKAIAEAEARIRALEAGGNTEKTNVSTTEAVPVAQEPAAAKVDLSKLMDESAKAVEADPNIQEARRRLDGNGLETKAAESDPELGQKRSDFWTALRKRGNVWNKGRNLFIGTQKEGTLEDFKKIKEDYDESLAHERDAKMKAFVESLDVSLSPEQRNAQIIKKYIELMQTEENQIDAISTSQEVSGMTKFKSWWKKHANKRLFIGAGMVAIGASAVALGAISGVGLAGAFVAGRGIWSGLGTYMGVEGGLDTRSAGIGQKGLIDQLKNIGFKRGKNAEITYKDKERALELLRSDKYTLADLEKEHARLRVLSLDKSKGIEEAGRFGAEQTLMIQAVNQVYYEKKAKEFADSLANKNEAETKAGMLASFLSQEKAATEDATSQQDKSRRDAMIRHSAAAALGLTVGFVAGSSMWDKTHVDPTTPVPETVVAPVVPPVEEIPTVEIPDGLIGKGDTVWGMVEDHLKSLPGWDELNEAEKTRYINFFEDKVVDDPSAFGLTDPDHLQPGTTIKWGDLFADKNLDEGMRLVRTLTPEQMQNIVENNKILSEAAKHGVEITSKNVDIVIDGIRTHGLEQYLAEHGHATAQAFAENAQDIAADVDAETAAEVASEAADSPATEALEQTVSDGKVEGFLTGARAYTGDIYESIQSYAETNPEHAHEQMSALVNKVFESSAQVQQDFLQDLNPTDFTEGNNKAEVFLKMIQASGNKLSEIDSADKLKGLISSFDHLAHNPELPVGKAFEPRLIFGEDGSEAYVFIKSAGKKVLGLFGEKQYVIDGLSGTTKIVTEEIAKTLLNHNNVA